jgi:aryl-alcohol dehydrogenase-like predicted oxidoreductase
MHPWANAVSRRNLVMRYRKLGRSNLDVSVVCQGTWSVATRDFFWENQDRADSVAAIHAGLDAGVNFFDTAPAYGNGESEEILGQALGGHRREVIVGLS